MYIQFKETENNRYFLKEGFILVVVLDLFKLRYTEWAFLIDRKSAD